VTSQLVAINVLGDSAVEPDEGFVVTLNTPSASGTITTATASGTIQNDDTSYAIAATSAIKAEGNSPITPTPYTFTVTRSGITTGISTVDYAVTGSATNPAVALDFLGNVLPTGTVVFADGMTSRVVPIYVVGNSTLEPDEGFVVTLNSPSNPGTITTAAANGTILNDDTAPTVVLSRNFSTINEAAGIATFLAVLSARSSLPVTVTLGFSGTATATSDYTHSATQIVIPAGQLGASITVNAVQDALDELNETVVIDIIGVTNGTELGLQQLSTLILDDDAAPTVTLSVNNAIIAEAVGTTMFTATLSAVSGQAVTVLLAYSGTAIVTSDYTRSNSQIVIPAGQLNASITITAVQDALDELNETVIVDIAGVTNGTESGVQQQTTAIADDDTAPTVVLSRNLSTINEAAGIATFMAVLSARSSLPVTVTLGFSGTATATSDYTRSATQIVIPAGQLGASITVNVVQDALDELNETVVVDIIDVTNGTELGIQQRSTLILDDDAAPTVTLSVNNATIAEAVGTTMFTATLSAVSGRAVTVLLAYSGTATVTSDYTRSNTQIVIPAGQLNASITITAVQDALDELNETVIVDIAGVTNGLELGIQQRITTILDDDPA